MLTIDETNELLKKSTSGNVEISKVGGQPVPKKEEPVVAPPPPDVEEMMKLAASLQNVVDEGNDYSVKYLKGKNKGFTWTVSKGLANQCIYCPYIAMDDKDQNTHKKTYHKEQYKAEKEKEKRQIEIAKKQKAERIAEAGLDKPGWGKKRGQS